MPSCERYATNVPYKNISGTSYLSCPCIRLYSLFDPPSAQAVEETKLGLNTILQASTLIFHKQQ